MDKRDFVPFKRVGTTIGPKISGDSLDIPTGRSATLTVAANDSSALSKQQADYVCDGTADDVQVQAAIDALPASGGKILLLEGSFYWTSKPTHDNDIIIEGGGSSTKIYLQNDFVPFSFANISNTHVKGLEIHVSNGHTEAILELLAATSSVQHCSFENIRIMNDYAGTHGYTGIRFKIDDSLHIYPNKINNVYMQACNKGIHIDINNVNGWANVNMFDTIYVDGFVTMVDFDFANPNTTGCNSNTFINVKSQTTTYSVDGFKNIRTNGNIFYDCIVIDWHVSVAPNYMWSIHSEATNTIISGYQPNFNSTLCSNNSSSTKLLLGHVGYINHENIIIVSDFGGNHTKLSDAFLAITPSDSNRYCIVVIGKITDDAVITSKSYVNVIGLNADIESTLTNGTCVLFDSTTNTRWDNIKVRKTGVATAEGDVVYCNGTDSTNKFINCEFINESSGFSYQHGLTLGNHITKNSTGYFNGCIFKGPIEGNGYCMGVYIAIWGMSSPDFVNCISEGGGGGSSCHGWYIAGGNPRLQNCIGKAGSVHSTASAFVSKYSSGEFINCTNELYKTQETWSYDDVNNGRFQPYTAHPYQLINIYVRVASANIGVTLDFGSSIGGDEIASNIDIGTTGLKVFTYDMVEIATNGYMYATPSAGITDGDIFVHYEVVKNYDTCRALEISTKARPIFSNCTFVSNGASDALYITETTVKDWRMSNCHIETLDPTNQYALNASGAITDVPIRNCTLIGDINNITSFVDDTYRAQPDLFMDVLAVSTTHIRGNEDLSAATPITFTLTAQPDVPRTLSWSFDTHAQITEYDMEVVGIGAKGNTITETWDETAGWSGETSNAFATITSIKMTSRTGTGAGDTMDIGITDVLGLINSMYNTSDVFKIKKNNANATVATAQVNTTYNTYDMSVIGLAATDDFTIWYKSNLNIIS